MTYRPTSPGTPGRITIDLAVLRSNWASLADFVAPAQCGAVVKADAYGLGAKAVIPALLQAGCRVFFVATLAEGANARGMAPDGVIYVLDGVLPGSAQHFLPLRVRPVLSSLAEVLEWRSLARSNDQPAPAALHVDSGLNRLGLTADEVARIHGDPKILEGIEVTLIMSHLASADDPASAKNKDQLAKFAALRRLLPVAPASLAASDGLMLGREYHFDIVRPGYALYGGQAFQGARTPVEPVVKAEASVLQVRDVAAGDTIGYSATYTALSNMRVAIIAAGYADGVARQQSAENDQSGGSVAICGRRAPIVGRVSMDLIAVDVTHLQDVVIERGTMAELIGPTLPLETVGENSCTIGYEVLTRLSRRFQRVYSDDIS